jgi:hypothetical protein
MGPHFRGFVFFNGTGMGLLLGDADCRQSIENDLAFDFQLSGQIVDSNLTHPPFLSSDCSAKSSYQPHGVSFQIRAFAIGESTRGSHLLFLGFGGS